MSCFISSWYATINVKCNCSKLHKVDHDVHSRFMICYAELWFSVIRMIETLHEISEKWILSILLSDEINCFEYNDIMLQKELNSN